MWSMDKRMASRMAVPPRESILLRACSNFGPDGEIAIEVWILVEVDDERLIIGLELD